MRDFGFIHSMEDVGLVLKFASEAGLIVREDGPTDRSGPVILEEGQFSYRNHGQFMGYRDEWIFGDLRIYQIDAGAYQGKFSMSPGVNMAGIKFYFMGERELGNGQRRLGNGEISRPVDWYSPEDHAAYLPPPEVKEAFDQICRRLRSGRRLRAGGRTYNLLDGALTKIKQGYLPPFNFIQWPEKLL